MKFDHLLTFRQVAHARSFTRAAQNLFMTQPTVTQHIQSLERELNIKLFYRSRSDTRLTPAGHALLKNVDSIFNILDDVKASFQKYTDDVFGELSIGASTIMGTYFLPPFIAAFIKKYKNVNLSMHYGNAHTISEWVQSGVVDLGFAPYMPGFAQLEFSFVHREACRFVVGKDHPLAASKGVGVEELADVPFIMREKGAGLTEVVGKWIAAQVWPGKPPVLVTCTDMDAIKKIVESGAGITVLPEIALEREFAIGLLSEVAVAGTGLHVDYHLVNRQNQSLSQAATSFLALLEEIRDVDPEKSPAVAPRPGA